MSKRMRSNTGKVVQVSQKRPIDKSLKNVQLTINSSGQAQVDLITATFPCTILGLRWDFTSFQVGQAASDSTYVAKWAIVIIRDGLTADTLGVSSGDLYNPEQNVLAFGDHSQYVSASSLQLFDPTKNMGSTKTMRKLMGGDKIAIVANGGSDANADLALRGTVQFFCKS
jgi:cell division protein FtsI/penicillin-binding protein 2